MEKRRDIEYIDYQDMVIEFMKASGQPTGSPGSEKESLKQAKLRDSLFQEEIAELAEAFRAGDRTEMLDGLGDAMVVALGTASTWGHKVDMPTVQKAALTAPVKGRPEDLLAELGSADVADQFTWAPFKIVELALSLGFEMNTFTEAFRRIHASNMTKFCTSEPEAEATVTSYGKDNAYWKQEGELFVVLRRSDNKVLKSLNFEPVSLGDLIK